MGGEGASRASLLRFGRKGDKGLLAAGRVGGPSGRCTHTTAGAQAGGAGVGCGAGTAATLESLGPGRGPREEPGARLAFDQWGESVAPEALDAGDGSRAAPPECNFERCVPGQPPKATARREERPKEKKGVGWGRGWERRNGVISTNWALS